ncbi:MAG: HAD family hydrolase [Lachnospiraceae bacterium]|nr:HAD family hydrolase [Lachnospiraceae bacterium]
MPGNYQNVIFDLYGTLIRIRTDLDSMEPWRRLAYHLSAYGAEYTPAGVKKAYYRFMKDENRKLSVKYQTEWPEFQVEKVLERMVKEAPKKHTARLYGPDEETLYRDLSQIRRTLTMRDFKLYRGALQLIDRLHAEGRKVYLLSNAQAVFTIPELERTDLYTRFDGIYISSDFGYRKPDPRFMKGMLEEYGMKAEETVFIGNDYRSDVPSAAAGNVDCIYINSYKRSVSERKAAREAIHERYPDYDLRRITEVRSLLAAGKLL